MTHPTPRRAMFTLVVVLATLFAGQSALGQRLAEERWSEKRYGISLRPPLGAKLLEQTGDDYLLRILDPAGLYQITIAARQSRSPLTLEEVARAAQMQIVDAHPATELIEHKKDMNIGALPAQRMYFGVPQPQGSDALFGQLVARVNDRLFIVLEVRGSIDDQPQLRRVFEAVGNTLQVEDQQALAEQRRKAIEAGRQWAASLTPERLREAMHEPRYFRLLEDGRDVGYLRVDCEAGQFSQQDGVSIVVQTHIETGNAKVDSKAEYFRPFDAIVGEAWSIRTTVRRPGPNAQAQTAVETGAGTSEGIDIHVDGTAGVQSSHHTFPRPPQGYLPQVDARLLPRLLPHDAVGEYGFYWYNPATRKVIFRIDRLTPTVDGFVISSRLGANADPLRASYDAQGNLLEKDLGSGRTLKRSNLESLKTLWQLR